ncbi:TetR/AcrR family transcriptional regulator [Paenibacillus harenae]|uniref:TetR/AcrR family transcriptional regulator n=1 Tax=Paenibacillus harenae TaxID=306543 RepID=UPI000412708C|nr:TetR family transcriptional regulator [Paenibacillus harenae]
MTAEAPLTRETILAAADQVLRRYGPRKTSVVDIARFLQVSHGTLYRHFPSKSALLTAVTERWLYNSILLPLHAVAEKTRGSAEERLRMWFETLFSKKRTNAAEEPEMFAMYAAVSVEADECMKPHVEGLIGQIQSIVEYGVETKEFKPGNAAIKARALFQATSSFHHPAHVQEWKDSEIDKAFDDVWQLLMSGLK